MGERGRHSREHGPGGRDRAIRSLAAIMPREGPVFRGGGGGGHRPSEVRTSRNTRRRVPPARPRSNAIIGVY